LFLKLEKYIIHSKIKLVYNNHLLNSKILWVVAKWLLLRCHLYSKSPIWMDLNGCHFRQVVAIQRWLLMLIKVWLYIKQLFSRQRCPCLYKTNVWKLEYKNIDIFNNWKIIPYIFCFSPCKCFNRPPENTPTKACSSWEFSHEDFEVNVIYHSMNHVYLC